MALVNVMVTSFAAFLGAFGILYILRFRAQQTPSMSDEILQSVILLFRDGELVDATPAAMKVVGPTTTTFDQTCDILKPSFPDLRALASNPVDEPARAVNPEDHTQWVNISRRSNTIRLEFQGDIAPSDSGRERALLHDISLFSPQLIWQQDHTGKVFWSNAAYADRAKQQGNVEYPLFADIKTGSEGNEVTTQRVSLEGTPKQWFDVSTIMHEGHSLHFANDATALMRADEDRREFVQTLGKTFADLSIGLAIFGRNRQLAMFNPALLDMTNLPVGFLSAQPTIDTVLDRLREMRIMPEPKDYTSWRDQFTAVETAAKDGTYSENWALPDGQTYRVTGRPHPDGAFALLFEDISAEMSLTRRFRTDIETSQAVLDTLPDAIAVFSSAGTMVISNSAYSRLWSTPNELMLEHREVQSEFAIWQDNCIASPMWTQMRDFIQRIGTRKPWSDDAMLVDGRHIRCHALPIAGGMTMVRFVIAPPMRPVIQKLTQVDQAIRAGKV